MGSTQGFSSINLPTQGDVLWFVQWMDLDQYSIQLLQFLSVTLPNKGAYRLSCRKSHVCRCAVCFDMEANTGRESRNACRSWDNCGESLAPPFISLGFTSSRNRNLSVKKTALRHLGFLPSAQKCWSATNHLGADIENVWSICLTLSIWCVA